MVGHSPSDENADDDTTIDRQSTFMDRQASLEIQLAIGIQIQRVVKNDIIKSCSDDPAGGDKEAKISNIIRFHSKFFGVGAAKTYPKKKSEGNNDAVPINMKITNGKCNAVQMQCQSQSWKSYGVHFVPPGRITTRAVCSGLTHWARNAAASCAVRASYISGKVQGS